MQVAAVVQAGRCSARSRSCRSQVKLPCLSLSRLSCALASRVLRTQCCNRKRLPARRSCSRCTAAACPASSAAWWRRRQRTPAHCGAGRGRCQRSAHLHRCAAKHHGTAACKAPVMEGLGCQLHGMPAPPRTMPRLRPLTPALAPTARQQQGRTGRSSRRRRTAARVTGA